VSEGCIVVGSGGLLGQALARRFGREGLRLSLLGRRPEHLSEQVASLAAEGIEARSYPVDVGDSEALGLCLDLAEHQSGPTSVLIYNACAQLAGHALKTSNELFRSQIEANVMGAFFAARPLGEAMRERGGGSILITGAAVAFQPVSTHVGLTVGKAALRAFAFCLADDLAPEVGVTIFEITALIKTGDPVLDPDVIAARYWETHKQPTGQTEILLPATWRPKPGGGSVWLFESAS
jgi:NAD(P)-dependent dehydrogenase (short-subunit alcohol dehydrogenase family)